MRILNLLGIILLIMVGTSTAFVQSSIAANQDPEFNLLYFKSPLMQFKSGIASKDVKCHDNLLLTFKAKDGSPACVKPETAKILYERGWALVLSVNLHNSNPNQPVDVISILSDSSPANPGGPPVKITLKNDGVAPITSLKATLHLNNEYVFDFANVTQSKPLTIGNLASDSRILIGAGFDTKLAHLLTISGIANKTPFNFTENVWISSTSGTSAKEHSVNAKVPDSFVVCDTPYEYKQGFIPVLYMPTNSDGKVCVNYWNPNHPKNASLTIFDAKSYHVEKSITTWAEPDLIPIGNSTVTYTIKTGNQTGFYGMTVFCVGMPFAVGYDNNSNMSISDFPWEKQQTSFCPMMDFQFKVLATKNIGIKYIPHPRD